VIRYEYKLCDARLSFILNEKMRIKSIFGLNELTQMKGDANKEMQTNI